jgi:hypothetical protein
MRHDADAGQRPVEALPRPVAPRDRLVDAGGEQQLGRDLAPTLGLADLGATYPRADPAHARGLNGVRKAVFSL